MYQRATILLPACYQPMLPACYKTMLPAYATSVLTACATILMLPACYQRATSLCYQCCSVLPAYATSDASQTYSTMKLRPGARPEHAPAWQRSVTNFPPHIKTRLGCPRLAEPARRAHRVTSQLVITLHCPVTRTQSVTGDALVLFSR